MLQPDATDSFGNPVYTRLSGAGFFIFVEVKPGSSGRPPGLTSPSGSDGAPDFQVEATFDLGDGSPEECDIGPAPDLPLGGVPGINPPDFDVQRPEVLSALIDFGCRFDIHTPDSPCTNNIRDNPAYVRSDSTLQYCTAAVVGNELSFPHGKDTLLTVQVRDDRGNFGFPRSLVIRVP